jgi:large subunit ribosomal protein L18
MLKTDRIKRKKRIRSRLEGTAIRPRVAVFRSNRYIYAQAINDESGAVVAAITQIQLKDQKGTKVELATRIGEELASVLKSKKVSSVVFDRSGYRYHGRVKAIAEGLRTGGINV